MRSLTILLGSSLLALSLLACDAPAGPNLPGGGSCTVIAANCESATNPDGCACEGSNGTSWTCTYAESGDEDCCENDPDACTDEE